jgi:hypothetical protein
MWHCGEERKSKRTWEMGDGRGDFDDDDNERRRRKAGGQGDEEEKTNVRHE